MAISILQYYVPNQKVEANNIEYRNIEDCNIEDRNIEFDVK